MDIIIPPIRIVHWTRWFNSIIFEGKDKPIEDECLVPDGYQVNLTKATSWCTISPDQSQAHLADAIVFHAADYVFNDVPKQVSDQPWILYTLESPLTAPFRQDPTFMQKFDYLASYHKQSQFFFTYFSPYIMDVANRPLPTDFMKRKSKQAPILWIARNCEASSGREHYIGQLMKYVNVDSYGDCLNTKPFPSDKTREQLMSEYKFYLAIENANCDDYVTEKLMDTLKFSAVPIIDGPASYDGYLPTQRSAIRMDAYPDPRDLAKYIQFLDDNDDAYLAYFQYRKDALIKSPKERLDESFISLWSDQTAHDYRVSWCSICRYMVETFDTQSVQNTSSVRHRHIETTPRKDRFLVDNSCMTEPKWSYAASGPPYDSYMWTPTPKDEFVYDLLNPPSASSSPLPDKNDSHPSMNDAANDDTYLNQNDILAIITVTIMAILFAIWVSSQRSKRQKR